MILMFLMMAGRNVRLDSLLPAPISSFGQHTLCLPLGRLFALETAAALLPFVARGSILGC